MRRNRSQYGGATAGSIRKIHAAGFSGTAGIIWDGGPMTTPVRFGDGERSPGMRPRSGRTAARAIFRAAAGNGRPYCIGHTTAGKFEPRTRDRCFEAPFCVRKRPRGERPDAGSAFDSSVPVWLLVGGRASQSNRLETRAACRNVTVSWTSASCRAASTADSRRSSRRLTPSAAMSSVSEKDDHAREGDPEEVGDEKQEGADSGVKVVIGQG
jgi:hypothetical protein